MKKNGFVMSTYVYMLLVFFLLVILSMLAVLNNSRLLSNKLKEKSTDLNIVLIGNKQINLELGTEYIEPGYVAQTATGEELEVDITSDLDVTHVGTYSITYTAKKGTNTISETRTIIVYKKFVTYITNLYNTDASSNGLEKDNTTGENIRYVGASPKNYVTFNNELWRIIGIFNVSNGTTTEPRIKLIRDESIGEYSWDSSASDVNNGNGVNEWSEADVKNLLNTYYLNQTSGNCYNGANNAFTTCDFSSTSSIKGLDSAANSLIENTVWNTGAITHVTTGISVDEAYTSERGTITGKTCTSGDECNDSVTRTTAWTGKVGLMYPSDYGYASTNTSCRSNIYDTTNNPCQNNNWLHKNATHYRTITPSSSASAARSWLVVNAGRVGHADNYSATNIFPVVYLKSSVNVIGGDGTQASPYQLSI